MVASIPRFLLPLRGSLWQQRPRLRLSASPSPASLFPSRPAQQCLRQASSSSSSGGARRGPGAGGAVPAGNVLEKPAKFNPPSHGARLPRKNSKQPSPASLHYGGDLSAAEKHAQRVRQYPGMMAPKGTWAHWFWTSRAFHLTLTMATLTVLGLVTFFENLRRTSPFADLLPSADDAWQHPFRALHTTLEVLRLTEQHKSELISARRQQRIDDVAKRAAYRKAHGLDETVGFGSTGSSVGDGAVGQTLRKWFGDGSGSSGSEGEGGEGSKAGGLLTEPEAPSGTDRARATSNYDDASPVRGAVSPAQVAGEAEVEAEAGKKKKTFGFF